MGNPFGKGSSVPLKIVAGLALTILLGLGLCGAGAVVHNDTLTGYCEALGALCFFGGILLLIVFGIGWAIVAICQQLFGKKD